MAVANFLQATLLIVSAIFPIVNPLGGSPIFFSLTDVYCRAERQTLARRIAINSFFLLVGAYLVGAHILSFFGISLPVVQVGGGLVVVSAGWAMLQSRGDEERREVQRNLQPRETVPEAFYPLTLPLTVGPGSISVAITLGANSPHHYPEKFADIGGAIVGSALVAASVYLCYGFADRLAKVVGPTGMSVIARLSSFLLVCIGVQIIWNGVKALLAH